MKEKLIVAGIVVFGIFFVYLNVMAMKQAEDRQCDGSTRFYAYTGKIYSCDNYKKQPQVQQQESDEWTNN